MGPRPDQATIRVVIVEDHPLTVDGMKLWLEADKDITVVAITADGQDAVHLVATEKPDVVLMDLELKDSRLDGIQSMQGIRQRVPSAKILVLSQFDDEAHVIRAFSAGALGYAVKVISPQELLDAVRQVAEGRPFIHYPIHVKVSQILGHLGAQTTYVEHDRVTDREQDVLDLLVEGMSNKEIADTLSIEISTVKTHLQHIYQKLNVSSRQEARLIGRQLQARSEDPH